MFELTPDNAAEYLQSRGWVSKGPVHVEALAWGVSNLVLRVTTPERLFIVKQSRPQLRTREAWFSNLDRVFREVEVMRLLGPMLPPGTVPEVLFEDRENFLFGMAHAPQDAVVWKQSLLEGRIDPAVAWQAGIILGTIHEKTAHQPRLAETLGERTAFRQLRIEPFYERVRERRPEVADAISLLIERMQTASDALCHGDFSPKNFLVHQPNAERGAGNAERRSALRASHSALGDTPHSALRITLVDYETAHYGDPTMDLGFFLSHLILKAVRNQDLRSQYYDLTRVFWQAYDSEVRFAPHAELGKRGIQHFGVCLLARIDGTSPVDYLPEEGKRETVRRIGRRVLAGGQDWDRVLEIVKQEISEPRP